jgi:hypothetical protein
MRQVAMIVAVAAMAAIWSTAFAQNSGNEPTPRPEVPRTTGQAPKAPIGHRQPQVKDLRRSCRGNSGRARKIKEQRKLQPSPKDRKLGQQFGSALNVIAQMLPVENTHPWVLTIACGTLVLRCRSPLTRRSNRRAALLQCMSPFLTRLGHSEARFGPMKLR